MISKLELKRNIFHMVSGAVFLLLMYFDILTLKAFTGLILISVALYFINLKKPLPMASFFIKNFEREDDKRRYPGKGSVIFALGIYFAFILYPKDIALAAIAILTFGDSIAPLLGHMGRIKHPFSKDTKKLLEGSIAGVFVGFVAAMLFVRPLEAFLASSIAMTFETVEIRLHPKMDRVNDNIIIPFIAGIVIVILRLL